MGSRFTLIDPLHPVFENVDDVVGSNVLNPRDSTLNSICWCVGPVRGSNATLQTTSGYEFGVAVLPLLSTAAAGNAAGKTTPTPTYCSGFSSDMPAVKLLDACIMKRNWDVRAHVLPTWEFGSIV